MPIAYNAQTFDLHVTLPRDEAHGLCGATALAHCSPPKAIEIGRTRQRGEPGEGSAITLAELELEAGWLISVARHPESPKPVDVCRGCLSRIGKMRDRERRRGVDGRVQRKSRSAGDDVRSEAARRREAAKLADWIEETADEFGNE